MFDEKKMFYKFETVYAYDPDFHLMFDNVDNHRIENVLFKSRETAISFLHNHILGEIEEVYCGEWDCIPMKITIQDMPDDNTRFLVYEKDYLVAILKLKFVGYSFV